MNLIKAISADGTEIYGQVLGNGPPLVFLPPGPANSEKGWQYLVPYLEDRFTCYLVNTRGRGLSKDHPDHTSNRLIEDVIAFIEAIDEFVSLVEWGSGLWAYLAATAYPAIQSIVVYEPGVDKVMPEKNRKKLNAIFASVWDLTTEKKFLQAAEFFVENSDLIYKKDEIASGYPSELWITAAKNLPIFLAEQQHMSEVDNPDLLSKIKIPVLLLQGTESKEWFKDSVKYLVGHLLSPVIYPIEFAAHFGPYTHPEIIALAIKNYFSTK